MVTPRHRAGAAPANPELRGNSNPHGGIQTPSLGLSRFPGQKRIAVNVECPGVLLSFRPAEGIDGRPDPDVLEPNFLEHPFPACARQAPRDSTHPYVDV